MLMIDSHSFGHIVIDGKEYTSDVIIFPDHVEDHWWRQSGHSLVAEDIIEFIRNRPDILIIGCGVSGVLKISYGNKRIYPKAGNPAYCQEHSKGM